MRPFIREDEVGTFVIQEEADVRFSFIVVEEEALAVMEGEFSFL